MYMVFMFVLVTTERDQTIYAALPREAMVFLTSCNLNSLLTIKQLRDNVHSSRKPMECLSLSFSFMYFDGCFVSQKRDLLDGMLKSADIRMHYRQRCRGCGCLQSWTSGTFLTSKQCWVIYSWVVREETLFQWLLVNALRAINVLR